MQKSDLPEDSQKTKINLETAVIGWGELERFFAAGQCIFVAPELDLVEVAQRITDDDAAIIKDWMEQDKVNLVSDEQAIAWLEQEASVWSVVVKPWVLVQPKEPVNN